MDRKDTAVLIVIGLIFFGSLYAASNDLTTSLAGTAAGFLGFRLDWQLNNIRINLQEIRQDLSDR